MDFLKNAFSKAKGFVSNLVNKPNISTPTGDRYAPPPKLNTQAPNMSTPKGPAYAPPPVLPIVTKPSTSINITPPVSQGNTYSQDQLNQSRVDAKFTNNIEVNPKSTVKSSSLSPDNTTSALKQARKQMEDRFLAGLKPSDNLNKLAEIQNERADLEDQYDEEYKALKANPEGKLSTQLNSQLQGVKERQNDQLAKIAVREGIALGIVTREEGMQDTLLKNIKEITALTQDDMVGSLQTDDVTGEISAFFRNPETGEMRQEVVGQTTIKPDYDIRTVGGRVVALDSAGNIVKDIGSSSEGGGGSGTAFTFSPTDRQALFASGMSQDTISQVQRDINTFGFDAGTAGLTSSQKQAVTKVAGGTSRFINTDYIKNDYFANSRDVLEEQALEAGYGSKGFLGFGKNVSDAELTSYINAEMIPQIEAYRTRGLDDNAILKTLFE